MFLIDDILLSPLRGFVFIAKEIREAALKARREEAAQITQRLSSLYAQLEAGAITEAEFDALEEELLDRLEALQPQNAGDADNDEDEEDDGEDEDGSITVTLLGDDEEDDDEEDDEDDDNEDEETSP